MRAAQPRRARGFLGSGRKRERSRRCAPGPSGSARRSRPVFARRAAEGAHRECHGDLHLQNLLWRDDKIAAFDALEFDRKLREVDVISETAFLAMDLHAHGRTDLEHELLNRYLEVGGDYGGIERAALLSRLPRARARQGRRDQARSGGDRTSTTRSATSPRRSSWRPPRGRCSSITHGLSGSGKTTMTDELVSRLPAIRARSDLERKRLHGLAASARSGSGLGTGLYSTAATRRTYAALTDDSRRPVAQRPKRDHRRDVLAAQRTARVPPGRRCQRGAVRDPRLRGLPGRAAAAHSGARTIGPRRVRGRPSRARAPAIGGGTARSGGTAARRDGRYGERNSLRRAGRAPAHGLKRIAAAPAGEP